jgi:hypothetical protein
MNACALGSPDLTITKVHPDPITNPHNIIYCEGKIKGFEVNINMTFWPKIVRERVDAMSTEARIYGELGPILDVYTPNILPFLGNRECETFVDAMEALKKNSHKVVDTLFDRVSGKGDKEEDLTHVNLLITKKPRGSKLSEWFEQLHAQEKEKELLVQDVLFQLAYTLVVFEDLGLMHHSLTTKNVYVEKLVVPLHYSAKISEEVTVTRTLSYFVEIQDFTGATKVPTDYDRTTIKNTYLDKVRCKKFGDCNTFRKNMDWFSILQSISTDGPYFYNLMKKIVLYEPLLKGVDEQYNVRLVESGRPCKCNLEGDCDTCENVDLDNESLIVAPSVFLKTSRGKCRRPAFVCPSAKLPGAKRKTSEPPRTPEPTPSQSKRSEPPKRKAPEPPKTPEPPPPRAKRPEPPKTPEPPPPQAKRPEYPKTPAPPKRPAPHKRPAPPRTPAPPKRPAPHPQVKKQNGEPRKPKEPPARTVRELRHCLNLPQGDRVNTLKEIKTAYKSLSLEVHPDKCSSDEFLDCQERFKEVDACKKAYDKIAVK